MTCQSDPFHVRVADWRDANDRNALRYVRTRVFIEEQNVPEELEWDDADLQALHVIALKNNKDKEVIATARLLVDGQIGRMAVLPCHRRQGIGSAMLAALITAATKRGLTRVFLHAQLSAVDFYKKTYFIVVSEQYMEAGIAHVTMEKKLTLV